MGVDHRFIVNIEILTILLLHMRFDLLISNQSTEIFFDRFFLATFSQSFFFCFTLQQKLKIHVTHSFKGLITF
jgi:hypothetical protein